MNASRVGRIGAVARSHPLDSNTCAWAWRELSTARARREQRPRALRQSTRNSPERSVRTAPCNPQVEQRSALGRRWPVRSDRTIRGAHGAPAAWRVGPASGLQRISRGFVRTAGIVIARGGAMVGHTPYASLTSASRPRLPRSWPLRHGTRPPLGMLVGPPEKQLHDHGLDAAAHGAHRASTAPVARSDSITRSLAKTCAHPRARRTYPRL